MDGKKPTTEWASYPQAMASAIETRGKIIALGESLAARAALLAAACAALAALKSFEAVMAEHESAPVGDIARPIAFLRGAVGGMIGMIEGRLPPVERTPEVGTSYTRAALAAAVDDAHGALHEADALLLGRVVAEGTTDAMRRAHEALHNVGAGQERIACATPDPEAQAIHADLRALRDREIPCGHTVADLIGGTEKGPDGKERPSITKCGACLAIRQPEIIAARQAKAAAERTPEVVLRAMLRAYEAYVVRKETAMLRDADMAAKAGWEAALGDLAHVRRAVVLLPIFGEVRLFDSALADYEARLRGERPLDAPPMEAP